MKIPNDPNWKTNYDTFSWWLEDENFQKYREDLGEDLLQIESVHENCVIDVGWYPMGKVNGQFVIQVIKDFDWENPVLTSSCKTPFQVIEIIEKIMKND